MIRDTPFWLSLTLFTFVGTSTVWIIVLLDDCLREESSHQEILEVQRIAFVDDGGRTILTFPQFRTRFGNMQDVQFCGLGSVSGRQLHTPSHRFHPLHPCSLICYTVPAQRHQQQNMTGAWKKLSTIVPHINSSAFSIVTIPLMTIGRTWSYQNVNWTFHHYSFISLRLFRISLPCRNSWIWNQSTRNLVNPTTTTAIRTPYQHWPRKTRILLSMHWWAWTVPTALLSNAPPHLHHHHHHHRHHQDPNTLPSSMRHRLHLITMPWPYALPKAVMRSNIGTFDIHRLDLYSTIGLL